MTVKNILSSVDILSIMLITRQN